VPVPRSALEELLVTLEQLWPPVGAPEEHRLDWYRLRATLLDLVRRATAASDPASSRLATGLVDEALGEAGLMFQPPGAPPHRGRHHRAPTGDDHLPGSDLPAPDQSEPSWRAEMESLIRRYQLRYPGFRPRSTVPAPPPRSTDAQRYRRYFRLTDPTTGPGPGVGGSAQDRAIWQAHRAEHLEAVAAELFGEGSCGSELARKAAAAARGAAHRAALGY
jgi:hypothetical protein